MADDGPVNDDNEVGINETLTAAGATSGDESETGTPKGTPTLGRRSPHPFHKDSRNNEQPDHQTTGRFLFENSNPAVFMGISSASQGLSFIPPSRGNSDDSDADSEHIRKKPTKVQKALNEVKGCVEIAGFADPKRVLPITQWLPNYSKSKLVGDLIAGITVGIMLLPQGMAYSTVAGLPPIYGLYGAYMGLIVYCFTGTSKDVTSGPTALMSLIVSHSFDPLEKPTFDNPCSSVVDQGFCCQDGDDYLCTPVNLAIALSFVTGIYQLGMGILNLGWVIDFIGFPVLNGFTSAAAVTIFTSQIKFILGLSEIRRDFAEACEDIVNKIEDSRWQDVVMGFGCIFLTFYLEQVAKKYGPRKYDTKADYIKWLCGTARNSIVIVVAIIVARIVAAVEDDLVFSLIREVPSGIGNPVNPLDGVTSSELSKVWPAAIVTSTLGFLESIAIGKAFAQKDNYDLDPTQELRALGLGNFVNSFFQGYPITGSFSRTAVNNASHVQTPMAGLVTGAIVIISLYALTDVFFYIPKASLGAIIMMSVVHMISFNEVRRIAHVNPVDLLIWLTSFLGCLFWSLEFGILLAVGVSILFSAGSGRSQRLERLQRDNVLGIWEPDEDYKIKGLARDWAPLFVANTVNNVIVLKIAGNLEFVACTVFKDRLAAISKNLMSDERVGAIVLDMSSVTEIDYTGVQALEYVLGETRPARRTVPGEVADAANTEGKKVKKVMVAQNQMGVQVHLACLQGPVFRRLKVANMFGGDLTIGQWKAFHHGTIDVAIREIPETVELCEKKYPFPWMAPLNKSLYLEIGATAIGQDDKTWIVAMNRRKKKIWTRSGYDEDFKESTI